MAYEQKEGGGTLFKNTQKQGSQPDWRGDCLINGKKMKIAAWEKQGSKGMFLSLKIQEDNYQRDGQQNKYSDPHQGQSGGFGKSSPQIDEMEDQIPF